MSDPLCKRTAQLRRRPGPQPAAPTRAEIFREAFMAALTGLCAQYEQRMLPNGKPCFSEGQSELTAQSKFAAGRGILLATPWRCLKKRRRRRPMKRRRSTNSMRALSRPTVEVNNELAF